MNDALEDENRKNLVIIKDLKEKLCILQKKETVKSDLLLCDECEIPAEILYELGEHVGDFHTGLRSPCNFCAYIYVTKKELEKHEEEVHNLFSRSENS